MFLGAIEDVRAFFSSFNSCFAGVGMTAFSRIVPGSFLDSYHIVALRKTLDLPMMRKERDIFCLEEEISARPAGEIRNSTSLLAHPVVKGFLRALPQPSYLLLYQNYPELEILAKQEGWRLLANPASLRMRVEFEDGANFTYQEFKSWVTEAGFKETQLIPLTSLSLYNLMILNKIKAEPNSSKNPFIKS